MVRKNKVKKQDKNRPNSNEHSNTKQRREKKKRTKKSTQCDGATKKKHDRLLRRFALNRM